MMSRQVVSEGRSRTVNAVALTLSLAFTQAVVSPVLAQRPYGIDVSHWQGTINWPQVAAAGYEFAWTKATESPFYWDTRTCAGSWYQDNTLAYNMTNARSAGILIGCYHFCHPQCYTATYEATGFVSRAGAYITAGYFRPVLDLEDGSSMTTTALSTWVNAWLDSVESQTGVEPFLYTNTNYATYELNSTVASRDLWIAQYFYTPNPQGGTPSIGVFNTWQFWQYSDSGTVPGVSGNCDLDVFNGLSAGLQAFVIGGTPPPPAFIVESRSGGQNYANYSETGTWGDNNSFKSSAPGCTAGIGHRWCTIGATGYGTATFRYTPTTTGVYEVFTTNCTTSNSGNPLIHKVAHAGGTANMGVCQNTTCSPNAVNVWYSLGQYTLSGGTQYTVILDGSTGAGSGPAANAGRSDAIKWQLINASNPPTITQHPAAQNVCAGATATFTVAASGDGTLSYQWQKNSVNITNGGHYSGTTTLTLTVSNADSGDVAGYRCVVSNAAGSTNSNQASLSLKAATTITQHPADKTADKGQTATFTVAATGDGTLSYQWQKNQSNLTNGGHYSGATTATLTISSAAMADAGSYRCVVTAGCGASTSNAATLTVIGQPGDFDGDTDVDQTDFAVLQNCLGVANPAANPTCAAADLNGDNLIDGQDATLFVGCMSGERIPADPNCLTGQR